MTSELDFAHQLRDAITRYLAAIDAWERKYGKTYRLPSRSGQITPDLEKETKNYREARQALEELVPKARLLYHANGIRDPFNTLLRVNLGAAAPQSGIGNAIGGNERTDVARGLVDLIAACAPIADPPLRHKDAEPREPGLLARFFKFFR